MSLIDGRNDKPYPNVTGEFTLPTMTLQVNLQNVPRRHS